ncbi:MAG TPA: M1 family metallopeptidase, partial [Blastocatellia bacterium]|nr:M1 family metallopeptidase [Blastocatellia bacterium]
GLAQSPDAPPVKWPRSHDYDVQHYRIAVSFDWSKKSVSGETTMAFRPFKNGFKEAVIDAGDMRINSVRLAGGGPLEFRYVNHEKLVVALDRPYPSGSDIAITINYSASPKKGLTFITPNESDPNRPYQIWSQGQSEDNHYWFPCYDYPNDFATAEILATVDEKYQVISNGSLISVRPDARARTRTWHWSMDKPFSSYLVSVVVGEFAEVKDQFKSTPVISYVYKDQVENGRVSFGKTAEMMRFFVGLLDFEYPFSKYAQVTTRDFNGGMENITATTLADTLVLDRRAHLDVAHLTDTVVSHELAHSWFGDMMTCRDWGELWLNESFATLFEALWTEHEKGRESYQYEMLTNQQTFFQAWWQGNRRPIVTRRYSNPDALFDAYSYQRGAAVLNMLRFVLGDDLFWKAVRHYIKKHSGQNVETQQLVIAIEEATGQNLQWFFDEWVYKVGQPEFEITSSYDGKNALKLSVRQGQKPDDKRPWFQTPEFFTMPVDIAVTTSEGEVVHRVQIDAREKEFTFNVAPKPLIINFDRGNNLIKLVKFNKSNDDLIYQLLNDADAMGRTLAAIELRARRGDEVTKALGEAAARDKFWAARLEAAKSLSEMRSEPARAPLIEAARDAEPRVRREAVKGLAQFKDAKLADLFIAIASSDQSYYTVYEALRGLGTSGAPQAFDVLMHSAKQES